MTETPWNRARRTRSERQERRNAALEGGGRQVNSGRFWRWRRDNTLREFLVESRTTEKDSYSIKRKEFHQLRKDAFATPPGHLPAMQIDIGDLHLFVIELDAHQAIQARIVSLEEALEIAIANGYLPEVFDGG